ncbi:MAG: ABC transporter substrate-binding protein/permease [Leptospirales bacterium]
MFGFYGYKITLKKFFLGVVCVIIFIPLLSPVAAKKPVLKALTDPSFVPFEMLDPKTKEMVGFDIDMLKEISRIVGFEYELQTMNFNGIVPALQTRHVDLAIAGITITKERQKVIDFSIPYYDSGLRILVRKNNQSIEKLEDLKGKSVATKIGSTSYDFLKKQFAQTDTKIIPYPNSSDMYMALLSKNVDAVFYDVPNVAYFAQTRGTNKVKAVGPIYQGQQYGIAMVKNSPWKASIDAALQQMRKDGSYDRIHEKWFSSTVAEEKSFDLDWRSAYQAIPYLMKGVPYTIGISFGGLLLGFFIGLGFGLMSLHRLKIIRWPAIAYIEFFRGTPVLVQVLFIFFGLPEIIGRPIDALSASVAAIALNSGAYISEIMRGGVRSIDKGQTEAGLSLGLSQIQTFRFVVWPQALKRMIPPLGNQAIISLKDTSLLSVIGVGELVRQGQVYIATTFTALEVYFVVALIYLAITVSLSAILRYIERNHLGEKA